MERTFWRRRVWLGALMVATSLAVVELAARILLADSTLPRHLVDVQDPGVLRVKLEHLRAHRGPKVVLLGDSLVYGGVMAQHGFPEWRRHTLDQTLETELRRRWPGDNVLVMNLGINGALPMDLERLVDLVLPCQPDWILLDTHLRPFSADFSQPNEQMARPWLARMSVDAESNPTLKGPEGIVWTARLGNWLADQSMLYRWKDLLRACLAEAPHAAALKAARQNLGGQPPTAADPDGLILLLQLQQRLQSVQFGPDNVQQQALERLLERLRQVQQPTIVFFAKENPNLVHQVLDRAEHGRLMAGLERMLAPYREAGITYAGPCPELRPEHFLDFAHLNPEGYEVLARYLAGMMKK